MASGLQGPPTLRELGGGGGQAIPGEHNYIMKTTDLVVLLTTNSDDRLSAVSLRNEMLREPLSASRTAHGQRGPPGLWPAGGEGDTVVSLVGDIEHGKIYNIFFQCVLTDHHLYETFYYHFLYTFFLFDYIFSQVYNELDDQSEEEEEEGESDDNKRSKDLMGDNCAIRPLRTQRERAKRTLSDRAHLMGNPRRSRTAALR